MLSSFRRSLSLVHKQFGNLRTNCYLAFNQREALLIDAADEGPKMLKWIKKHCPTQKINMMLTHGHFDHINSAIYLAKNLSVNSIMINKLDLEFYMYPPFNYSTILKKSTSITPLLPKFKYVNDGEIISIGNEDCKILHCPGHTPGSICLYSPKDKWVIVGDTLFGNTIGSIDVPAGDLNLLVHSICKKLLTLPQDTVVHSGHGKPTTIGKEKFSNAKITQYLQENHLGLNDLLK